MDHAQHQLSIVICIAFILIIVLINFNQKLLLQSPLKHLGKQKKPKLNIKRIFKQRVHEFIINLEDTDGNKGYSSKVGERGVKLSGGQRQRIALARVILKDAPILLMEDRKSVV